VDTELAKGHGPREQEALGRRVPIELYHPVMPNETQAPAVVDTARRMIRELRRGREALAPRVEAFTEEDLARQSACSEWDVSQVLSHLGSGAEIMIGTLYAVLAGDDPPGQEASEAIWARWNAMTRAERAAGWLEITERHLAALEALSDEQLRDIGVPVAFSPAPLDAAAFVSLRVNEQALHHWDVEVTFDEEAVIPESAAELVVDRIGWMMQWIGKADRWPGEPTQIALTLSAPAREWTLSIADAVTLDEAAAADAGARLTLSSETFIRLVSGRLRSADSARIDVEGPLRLDDVVTLFPGL
jgi:uncharacterized protein (TIGR03083 family)